MARQGRGVPQHLPDRIGHDLHVHAVATRLVRVVGAAVAHTVALGERPVEQYVFRLALAQDVQQAGCPGGQEVDHCGGVGMGRPDRDAEVAGCPGQGVVLAQVSRPTSARWCGGHL